MVRARPRACHGARAAWLVAVLCLLATAAASATSNPRIATGAFDQGRRAYATGHYRSAVGAFEQAAAAAPRVARYQYWLGLAYGRMAQHAGWLDAIDLAQRTRRAFERAVALDPAYLDALRALRDYYRQAPAFLGGGADKAAAVEARIRALERGGFGG